MEGELNEHELEERLYAMLHHVDETQNNLIDSQQNKDALQFTENGPRSTMRRYWRTSNTYQSPYQKVNSVREQQQPAPTPPGGPAPPAVRVDPTPARAQLTPTTAKITNDAAPKEEKSPPNPLSPVDLTLLQLPVPEKLKKTIVILDLENDNKVDIPVVLESSDEDEVVEVALPPKPTITIDSSDEEELCVEKPNQDAKSSEKSDSKSSSGDRAVSASPVPSVVSSVSDEFIRGDCIALNISSRHPDKHSFDFSLHGSDLLGLNTVTPSKKKKRKKNKESATSTPIIAASEKSNIGDVCFATPKSKAKNKKQKNKLFTEKSLPNPYAYDSDSSLFDATNKSKSYNVTERSLPNPDVYESDSNQSEIVKVNTDQSKGKEVIEANSSDSSDIPTTVTRKPTYMPDSSADTVDLTGDAFVTLDETGFEESIVMGNVIGFTESTDYGENDPPSQKGDISKYISSKVPSILNEDLDFDNLQGKEKVCKKRRYSITALRAEMDKFYNASWGGEQFDHVQILKNMPRDKSLWAIDPKDRMQSIAQRKTKCGYCNRVGHRADTCRLRPPVCYMCGNQGHFEPRCPDKICVNCGSPNRMYSSMCGACAGWARVQCAECGRAGHPATHCPDTWRRYHNTISLEQAPEYIMLKRQQQQFCSGCARRGHLVHACRTTLPFSGLPLLPPHVRNYRPLYPLTHTPRERSKSFTEDNRNKNNNNNNKRLSKSPTVHETHVTKKRHLSTEDDAHKNDGQKTPVVAQKTTTPKVDNNKNKRKSSEPPAPVPAVEKTPEFIPTGNSSSNHDNKGRVIQDNEVSDTSDAISASRIFVTDDVVSKLRTEEGEKWLQATSAAHHVTVGHSELASFLHIKGKLADQELFQSALREWVRADTHTPSNTNTAVEEDKSVDSNAVLNIPKNRNNLLRQINNALDLLKFDYGDPMRLYKELLYSQTQHDKMLKQKEISPKKLSHSRTHINDVLKKLNIILLGQAGLADGSDHIHELVSLQKKLMRSQSKNIPVELRKEVGQHYHTVFSPTARSDYAVLMKKYYVSNKRAKINKKKKKKRPPAVNVPLDKPSIPAQSNTTPAPEPEPAAMLSSPDNIAAAKKNSQEKENRIAPNQPNYLPKLMFYQKRLRDIKGGSQVAKQEVLRLQRRVHCFISMLYRGSAINSKNVKKVKKLNSQVEHFLAQTEK